MAKKHGKSRSTAGEWAAFTQPAGSAEQLRKKAASLDAEVRRDRKIVAGYSLINGGTKIKGDAQ